MTAGSNGLAAVVQCSALMLAAAGGASGAMLPSPTQEGKQHH